MARTISTDQKIEKALPPRKRTDASTDLPPALSQFIASVTFRGDTFPAWWTPRKDAYNRRILTQNDWIASATETVRIKLSSIPFSVQPKSRSIQAHAELSDYYNTVFQVSWELCKAPFVLDVLTQDNGGFLEILDAPGDLRTAPDQPRLTFGGLRHIDASTVQRTNDPDFPILVRHTDGNLYKLHDTRMLDLVSMPSADIRMNGVGLSHLSRAVRNIQLLTDISILYQEFLGSRPLSSILVGQGIQSETLKEIFDKADERMDAEGLSRFSRFVYVGIEETEGDLKQVLLKLLPEGFSKKDEIELAIMLFALAFGVDAREFWPATMTGATKGDALVQHMKMQAKTPAWFIESIQNRIMFKILPPALELVGEGLADDEGDFTRQQIYSTNLNTSSTAISAGIYDERVARVQALELGALPEEEFERLELEDGRLTDGSDVLTLFYVQDVYLSNLLDLSVEDPLDLSFNDSENMIEVIDEQIRAAFREIVQGVSPVRRSAARQAHSALLRLRTLYEEILSPAPEPALDSDEDQEGDNADPDDVEEDTGAEPDEEIPQSEDDESAKRLKRRLKSASTYGASIRQLVRNLWKGASDADDFIADMETLIEFGFTEAFGSGAKSCGIGIADYTDEERSLLGSLIRTEQSYLSGFANYIEDNSKSNGGKLTTCLNRAKLWENAYSRVKSEAQTMACANQKFEWKLGKSLKHCKSCMQVAGRVYRGSIWKKYNYRPQSPDLECGGFRCNCTLEKTDKALTAGRPPAIKQLKHKRSPSLKAQQIAYFDALEIADYQYFNADKRAHDLLIELHGERYFIGA